VHSGVRTALSLRYRTSERDDVTLVPQILGKAAEIRCRVDTRGRQQAPSLDALTGIESCQFAEVDGHLSVRARHPLRCSSSTWSAGSFSTWPLAPALPISMATFPHYWPSRPARMPGVERLDSSRPPTGAVAEGSTKYERLQSSHTAQSTRPRTCAGRIGTLEQTWSRAATRGIRPTRPGTRVLGAWPKELAERVLVPNRLAFSASCGCRFCLFFSSRLAKASSCLT
jgi:hypothetical protein